MAFVEGGVSLRVDLEVSKAPAISQLTLACGGCLMI